MSHWYDRDGNPRHFVGEGIAQRPSTLADARRYNWMPGFSGINGTIHEYFLNKWKSDQRVLSALTLTRRPNEPDSEFLKRLDQDAYTQADAARDEGKEIHDAIECHFGGDPYPEKFRPHVNAILRMLSDNFGEVDDWVSERTFACREGYGGAIDLHSPSHRVILDFKGADISPDEPKKKVAYSQYRQLAAYAHGIGWEPGTYRAGNLFVSRPHPGYVKFHPWMAADLTEGLDTFQHALAIWQNVNKFVTRW